MPVLLHCVLAALTITLHNGFSRGFGDQWAWAPPLFDDIDTDLSRKDTGES